MRLKAGLLIGIGVGYVLGARAGRESYERLMAQGRKVWHTAPAEEARARMTATMDEAGAHLADAVRKAAPGESDRRRDDVLPPSPAGPPSSG